MDAVKPALRVLLHAESKGAQIGAAAGIALVAPHALYKQAKPSLGSAACLAGFGMLVGSGVSGVLSAVKLARSDKAGIVERAERLSENVAEQKIDSACAAGAAVGAAYALKRIGEIAKSSPDAAYLPTLSSRRGAWTVVSYVALGVGAVYGTIKLSKAASAAVVKIKENRSLDAVATNSISTPEEENMVAAAVNGAAAGAADAVEAVGAAATEAADEVAAEAKKVIDEVTSAQ